MDKQDSAARTQHRVREKIHTQDARMQSRNFKKIIVLEVMILFMFALGGTFNPARGTAQAVALNVEPITGFDPDNPEAALCPPGQTSTILFFDDLENGSVNWTFRSLSGPLAWSRSSGIVHSGAYALQADGSRILSDSVVQMRSDIALPETSTPYLWFAHAYEFEAPNFDGGFFEVSTDSGNSWADARRMIDNGRMYDGEIYSAILGGNPNGSHPAYLDSSDGFVPTRVNLITLAGDMVRFRWRQSTDNLRGGGGWSLDDVRIYTCSLEPTPTDASLLSSLLNPPPTETLTATPTATRRRQSLTATNTPLPDTSRTPTKTATSTKVPTATKTRTPTKVPTFTKTAIPPTPTNTAVPPSPTNTAVPPSPTRTLTPVIPTRTNTPVPPTNTDLPPATNTSAPQPTNPPAATNTPGSIISLQGGLSWQTLINLLGINWILVFP
jgi:hypothetical protein